MYQIRFRPEVADDLRNAANWYDQKRAGLGDELIAQFWIALDQISSRPLAFATTTTGLRASRVARFPYVVHFRAIDNEIVVVAVMHGGRDSTAWMDRADLR